MKNTKIWLFVFLVILLLLGYYLGWLDNGPKAVVKSPTNYEECVLAGGKTNKTEIRVQDSCTYNGKVFQGQIF